MIIHHSIKLLEQLGEVEEKIKLLERVTREMGLEIESERLLRLLLAREFNSSDQ